MTMTDPIIDRLDQIKGRAEETTEGPWVAEYSGEQGNCVIPHDARSTREAVAVTRLYYQQADAEFIAAARTDVPALVDALIRVLEMCDRAISFPTPDGEMRQACIAMRETAEIIRDEIAVALGVETEGGES